MAKWSSVLANQKQSNVIILAKFPCAIYFNIVSDIGL